MAKEKEKPLTREDVLKKIEECRGKGKVPKFSNQEFKEGVDLSGQNLSGVIFMGARFLTYIDGERTVGANFRGADLRDTDLRDAHLEYAEFYEAELSGTKFEGAYINGAHITEAPDAHLGHADWGNFIIGEEKKAEKKKEEEKKELLQIAEHRYRQLKQWYTDSGYYDIAGEFFFREMTAQRKGIKWWPHPTQRKKINWWLHPRHRMWSKFVSLICGYGERTLRVIGWAVSVVFGLAFIYFIIGSIWEWSAFGHSLYFSTVSFTALGYGSWLEITNDWIKGIGAVESFIGVFTIALFLITFTRKMRR